MFAAVAPAADPAQVKLDLIASLDGFGQVLQLQLQQVPPPPSFFEKLQQFGTDWSGFLGLIFMFALVFVLWKSLKLMPRTKPRRSSRRRTSRSAGRTSPALTRRRRS